MPNDPDQVLTHLSRAARWLVPVVSAPTFVALAIYLGLHRYSALAAHFGMSVGLLNPSLDDYLERGIRQAAISVGITAGISLALFLAHAGIRKLSHRARFAIGTGCAIVGAIALALGLIGVADLYIFSTSHPIPPMLIAAAVILVPYGAFLRRRWPNMSALAASAIAAAIIFIDTFFALWIMGVYAQNSGVAAARELDANRPVMLCAARNLALPVPVIRDRRSGCRYGYPDLRQVACGEYRCMSVRREEDGTRTVLLVNLDDDVVVTTRPGRPRSPAI